MQNLFITSRGKAIADWGQAFPDAHFYSVVDTAILESAAKTGTVIWLHAETPQQDVAASLQQILQKIPQAKVVVLSNVPSPQHAFAMMAAGASGYCHAYGDASMLKEVRAVVEHGGLWLGRDLLQHLISVSTSLVRNRPDQAANALDKLTARERDVAVHVANGLSNKEIARLLNITERTVKAHISACFERLNVKDRLQLALILNDKSSRQIS
ncbi:MAG TPA: response regulator transcription factor [Methylophilaceae bacterium]|jgi:DNA-binding NarL/FixJ family response regulator